jgi:hypothetical protein
MIIKWENGDKEIRVGKVKSCTRLAESLLLCFSKDQPAIPLKIYNMLASGPTGKAHPTVR